MGRQKIYTHNNEYNIHFQWHFRKKCLDSIVGEEWTINGPLLNIIYCIDILNYSYPFYPYAYHSYIYSFWVYLTLLTGPLMNNELDRMVKWSGLF